MIANASSGIRRSSIALVLALGVSVTTCRLDKLINPATADRFTVTPSIIDDSAHAGSAIDSVRMRITMSDGGAQSWTATTSAIWLQLSDSAGSTPDSVIVLINPDTLSQTLHEDTIVFVSAATGETIRVPVSVTVLAPAPELSVIPASRAETAFVGSIAPDTFSLTIDNTGALPLTWSAVVDSSWIAISKDTGSAPPAEMSRVTLTPGSRLPGTYTGAITVTAAPAGTVNSPATVPVTYVIKPCDETPKTFDAIVTDVITASDCGAPQRAGRQAKVYAFQANAGDTLSFRLTTTAFNPYLILTNGTGVAVLDSTDQCPGDPNTMCLLNFIADPPSGRVLIEVTTRDSGETGAFTLSAVRELSPSQPASAGQFRADGTTAIGLAAETPEATVVFKATLNDPNPSDSLRLHVELTDLTGGTFVDSSALVPRGSAATVQVSGLTENQGYHWRARACDRTTRCSAWFSFGGNPETVADFFVNAIPSTPDAPTQINQLRATGMTSIQEGGTAGNSGVSVVFIGIVGDPDPNEVIWLEVEVKPVGTAGPDSTGLARGATGVATNGTATVTLPFTGAVLVGTDYYWRAHACDRTNRCSPWVNFGTGTPQGSAGGLGPFANPDFHVNP